MFPTGQIAAFITKIILITFISGCVPSGLLGGSALPTIASPAKVNQPRANVDNDSNITSEPPTPIPESILPPTFTPQANAGIANSPSAFGTPGFQPHRLFHNAYTNLTLLASYGYKERVVVEIPSAWLTFTTEQDCRIQNPDTAHCFVSERFQWNDEPTEPTVTEWMQIGENSWFRLEGDLEWEEVPAGEVVDDFTSFAVIEYTEDVKSAREAVMEGMPVFEVIVSFNMRGFLDNLNSGLTEEYPQLQFDESSLGRLWINNEDSVLRRIQIDTVYVVEDEEISIKTKGDVYGINQAWEMPPPFDDGIWGGDSQAGMPAITNLN